MIFLQLYWSFVKIGFTSFGGMSMIPLISSEMASHNWMTFREISDIVAIAEMTPGPLGLNCATFAGIRTAGLLGALAANLGALTPTFTLCALAAVFFERFKNGKWIQRMMTGVRPACVGMVAGIVVTLSMTNYIVYDKVDLRAIFIGILDFVLILKYKQSVPKVIVVSAALGIIFWGIFPGLLYPQA